MDGVVHGTGGGDCGCPVSGAVLIFLVPVSGHGGSWWAQGV